MRTLQKLLLSSLLTLGMVAPATTVAQRSPGRTTTPARNVTPSKSSTPSKSTTTTRGTATSRTVTTTKTPSTPKTPSTRPSATPSKNNSAPNSRPAVGNTNNRPGTAPSQPNNGNRPGTGPSQPNNGNRPGTGPSQPNNGNRPGTGPSQPNNGNRPGTGPSQPNNGNRPGTGPSQPGGNRPSTSVSRPGGPYRPSASRPHHNYARPNYQPPRPGGGYWVAPPPSAYRPVYYAPVPPPRVYVRPGVPRLGTILGLTFGTFIDTSLNMLYNAGYNILGYANNIVYLGNVSQLGYIWPEATVYYSDGLVSDMQFQYWTSTPSITRYNQIYNNLTRTYGSPANYGSANGVTTTSWWAGGNTGFVTLQYGPGLSSNGMTYYYTTLTYSDYM